MTENASGAECRQCSEIQSLHVNRACNFFNVTDPDISVLWPTKLEPKYLDEVVAVAAHVAVGGDGCDDDGGQACLTS